MELIRKSAIRGTERPADPTNLINKLIADNLETSLRESMNPMPVEQLLLRCFSEGEVLSKEFLQTLVKMMQQQLLVIGLILPSETLAKCYKLLTAKEAEFNHSDLSCIFLHRHALADTNTLLFLLAEDYLPKEVKTRQKLLLNMSLVLITTEQYAKRTSQPFMQSDLVQKKGEGERKYERELLIKNASLMIIREEDRQVGEQLLEKLQSLFWNVESMGKGELQVKLKRTAAKDITRVYRQAYHGLSQENEQVCHLVHRLNEMGQIALKRNWKVSRGLLCYPFLYYLTFWLRDSTRNTKSLLEHAVTTYSKTLEQKFLKVLNQIKLPTDDELKLRNTLNTEKRNLLLCARKHLTMLEHLFPELQVAEHCVQSLNKFCSAKERNIYEENNIEAMRFNEILLRKIYSEVVEIHFEKEDQPERTLQDYQTDFQKMMEVYNHDGKRVSSQLKSFNLLLAEKKLDYTDSLSRELRSGKKKYVNQKEELKDKLQIQAGVLDNLEAEIKELLDKRTTMELENNKLKRLVEEARHKRAAPPTSDHSKQVKHSERSSDRKSPKKQTKSTGKINKPQNKKNSKCCCEIM